MKNSLIFLLIVLPSCQPKHSQDSSPPGKPETPSAAATTPGSFVGLTIEEAKTRAEKADLPHRIVSQDGKEFPVTRDYRPERLNFTVEKGIVTKVTNG